MLAIGGELHLLSHFVAAAIAEKLQRMEDEMYAKKINSAFKDPEIAHKQQLMANIIGDNTEVKV